MRQPHRVRPVWFVLVAVAAAVALLQACSSDGSGGQAGGGNAGSSGNAGNGGSSASGNGGVGATTQGGGSTAGSGGGGLGGTGGTSAGTTAAGGEPGGAGGEGSLLGPLKVTLENFGPKGQVTLFDVAGDQVDAHDGHIAFFEGRYWLYGTAYDCGFQWQAPSAPFCGFKSYSSTDLTHWTDHGYLFDGSTAEWQKRCDGNTYGCYRPKVIYNQKTQKYVLWVNVYDNSSGFRVFTGDAPDGPFTLLPEPEVSANMGVGAGLNDGDHALFVDDDAKAYIAYTDWRAGGAIAIEQLNAEYTSRAGGANTYTAHVTPGSTEAPALFRRGSTYHLMYSDPNCGYCGSADGTSKTQGTGTGYRTASSPLGPWSAGKSISPQSCGGQPSFVSAIALAGGDTAYLYGSDLWRGGAKNEALGNFYWAPLAFNQDGSLQNLGCEDKVELDLAEGALGQETWPANVDASSGNLGFTFFCDVAGMIRRGQAFTTSRAGTLSMLSVTAFLQGQTDAPLTLSLFAADAGGLPQGAALATHQVDNKTLGWAARKVTFQPNVAVTAGQHYVVTLDSATSIGCYGIEYSDQNPYAAGSELYSNNAGQSYSAEKGRGLKFFAVVEP